MKASTALCSAGLLVGAGLIAWGLQLPLAQLPVVGVLRFSETSVGAAPIGAYLVAALFVAALAALPGGRSAVFGAWLGGGACGWIAASLLAIHHGAIERLQSLADAGMPINVPELIAQIRLARGAFDLAGGMLLFTCTLLCRATPRPQP
jgi:hypothetical protein